METRKASEEQLVMVLSADERVRPRPKSQNTKENESVEYLYVKT